MIPLSFGSHFSWRTLFSETEGYNYSIRITKVNVCYDRCSLINNNSLFFLLNLIALSWRRRSGIWKTAAHGSRNWIWNTFQFLGNTINLVVPLRLTKSRGDKANKCSTFNAIERHFAISRAKVFLASDTPGRVQPLFFLSSLASPLIRYFSIWKIFRYENVVAAKRSSSSLWFARHWELGIGSWDSKSPQLT